MSSVSTAGNELILNVAFTFNSTFVGSRNVYLYAASLSGQNSGWAMKGTWTPNPSAGPPAIVSLTPNTGNGTAVTFQAIYADPNGAADLNEILLQVNISQSSANACYVYYQPQGKHLYLANDTGDVWMTPALTPGVAGTASNSQCTLNAGSSSAVTAGNDLTLNVALTFNSTVIGSRNVYLYAAGLSGQSSGWVKEGTWTSGPSIGPPAIVSLSPIGSTGNPVTFQAVYSDPNGAWDVSQAQLLVNTSISPLNGCLVYYQPRGNRLYLANDAGAWITPALTPGVAGTVSNSQCTVDAGLSSVTMAGNELTLNVALTFSSTVAGLRNAYLYALGLSGQSSGWTKEGTWTANPSAGPPVVLSLSPNAGTGTSVTFQTVVSDPNGLADLTQVNVSLLGFRLVVLDEPASDWNIQWVPVCGVSYVQQGNQLYLNNLVGNPLTPGLPGTVSDGGCTLNGGSSSVTTSGNNLTLSVALTFNGGGGLAYVYVSASELGGQQIFNLEGQWALSAFPEIASLSPTSIEAGSGSFTLTVNGFNFSEGSVVNWDNLANNTVIQLKTVFVSSTQLQATVPASYVATVGDAEVSVPVPWSVPSTVDYIISGAPTVTLQGPTALTGASAWLDLTYFDPYGIGDLNEALIQINTTQSGANACYVKYDRQTNLLYLADDAGSEWLTPGLTPGGTGTASNSQCTLEAASSSMRGLGPLLLFLPQTAYDAGTGLELGVGLTFNGTFVGQKNIYLYAAGSTGKNTGWIKAGTWTP